MPEEEATIEQMITAAKRELTLRKRVYPGQVFLKKMRSCDSHHELKMMEGIIRNLEAQIQKELPF